MDIMKMLAELRQEREQVEEAIMTLERVAQGRGKRRGRPTAWMKATKRRVQTTGCETINERRQASRVLKQNALRVRSLLPQGA